MNPLSLNQTKFTLQIVAGRRKWTGQPDLTSRALNGCHLYHQREESSSAGRHTLNSRLSPYLAKSVPEQWLKGLTLSFLARRKRRSIQGYRVTVIIEHIPRSGFTRLFWSFGLPIRIDPVDPRHRKRPSSFSCCCCWESVVICNGRPTTVRIVLLCCADAGHLRWNIKKYSWSFT